MRITRRAMLGAATLPLLAAPALAQTGFPQRPIRIVIGFPPGGGIDILARLMAPHMGARLGQPVVVENRPGANGLVATQAVLGAEPDGHTIFFGTTGNLAVNAGLYPNAGFDLLRDMAPLSLVASLPFVMVVNPGVAARDVAEFIALAKARPGTLNFASSGNGGLPHLSGELLNAAAGINTIHVPYRGSAPAFTDVIAGQCQFMFDALAIAQPHIAAGRVRALGVTGPRPMPSLPGVPTVAATVPGYEVVNWYGMTLRAGTPAPIVTRLQAEIDAALKVPEVAERSAALGLDLVGSTPDEFATFQRAEIAKWGEVVRRGNIKPD
ncbi:tripartite tricarboxylate transporter substrate binding protein [Roseomonas stagni]|uniref:Tripartite tricarboxylate transporter substrate binding protein n=1 Tax=Falsiroseomonas algicola TaxID=2716930 RepID=A0A6M1LKM0_9PROT|nr:tripartite tricarboxylate transporter substrate binding protein [Falsiroseomonas algicola]NGM20895.1 tripartite tricarboxylate transporter substrate binding protein [Falsiroseomonas algicola]